MASLGERTLHRYLRDPAFAAALHERQDAILAGTTAALSGLASEAMADVRLALRVLSAEAKGGSLHAVRLGRLALSVLAERRKQAELQDLVARVERLEERIYAPRR